VAVLLGVGLAVGFSVQASTARPARAPTASDVHLRIDPNTATAAELELLPGVGPKLAENIVAYRQARRTQGIAFHSAMDLDGVPRIGPATIERLRSGLALPDDASGPHAP
jgi:competence ComEA-like helix-hairpin-helix protein